MQRTDRGYTAGFSVVGSMPDSPPIFFSSFSTAKAYILKELHAEAESMGRCNLQRAAAITQAAKGIFHKSDCFSVDVDGHSYWVEKG